MANERYVVRQGDGWAVKRDGVQTPESRHSPQREAEQQAKSTVRGLGGDEVRIQGRDGQWRDSDTIAPARDLFRPRDRKH